MCPMRNSGLKVHAWENTFNTYIRIEITGNDKTVSLALERPTR